MGTAGSGRSLECRRKWSACGAEWTVSRAAATGSVLTSSGNRAFDDYRSETLKRLEEEQREFKDPLARLRFARDRAEFDQFMADRRQRPVEPSSQAEPPPADPRITRFAFKLSLPYLPPPALTARVAHTAKGGPLSFYVSAEVPTADVDDALEVQSRSLAHAVDPADSLYDFCRRGPVDRHQRDRRAALLVAPQREGRDIDARSPKQAREPSDEARLVLVGDVDHRRRELGVDLDALDRKDARLAVVEHRAADRALLLAVVTDSVMKLS